MQAPTVQLFSVLLARTEPRGDIWNNLGIRSVLVHKWFNAYQAGIPRHEDVDPRAQPMACMLKRFFVNHEVSINIEPMQFIAPRQTSYNWSVEQVAYQLLHATKVNANVLSGYWTRHSWSGRGALAWTNTGRPQRCLPIVPPPPPLQPLPDVVSSVAQQKPNCAAFGRKRVSRRSAGPAVAARKASSLGRRISANWGASRRWY